MPREETPYWTYESAAWVIFDLDGTLADITHRLHHIKEKVEKVFDHESDTFIEKKSKADWHAFNAACSSDDPKSHIISLLKMFKHYGKQIAIVSGRDSTYQVATEKWLKSKGVEWDILLMRAPKDYRSDTDIKKELFEKHFKAEDVWLVVDDRDKVVEMWRKELGLTCLQCQKGDY